MNQTVRILYHHRTQAQDAQGIHIAEMITAFRSLGHEVCLTAVSSPETPGFPSRFRKKLGNLRNQAPAWLYEILSLVYNLLGYRKLVAAIKAVQPDLIYERYSLNTFCGVWASRRCNIPLILEVNAPLYFEQSALGQLSFRRLAAFSEKWICSKSSWTITVTEVMRQILLREGVPAGKITVMHNGVDPKIFNPDVSGDTIRARYRLESRTVIGFVGWFRPWHGLEKLLDVLHTSGLLAHGVSVLLVGDGPALPELKARVDQYGIHPSVVFTGPVDRTEIPAHIAAMDIAVQPSVTEYACPMKLIEYMAMGRCVIAPSQPNIKEMVSDGINGILFEPDDHLALSKALLKAANDPSFRSLIGRNAYNTVKERRFHWQENARRVLGLLVNQEGVHAN